MKKYELKGMFKKYEQVGDLQELLNYEEIGEVGLENMCFDKIFIREDKNDDKPFYLEISVKHEREYGWFHDSLYGLGATLDEAEKMLEVEYEKYLNDIVMDDDFKRFPELNYVDVTVAHENALFDHHFLQNQHKIIPKFIEFYGSEECVLWVFDDLMPAAYVVGEITNEEFEMLDDNDQADYSKLLKEDSEGNARWGDGYEKLVRVPERYAVFKRGGQMYRIRINLDYDGFILEPYNIGPHQMVMMGELKRCKKIDMVNLWMEQIRKVPHPTTITEKKIWKVLKFLKDESRVMV